MRRSPTHLLVCLEIVGVEERRRRRRRTRRRRRRRRRKKKKKKGRAKIKNEGKQKNELSII
jgi:hypothetical protein